MIFVQPVRHEQRRRQDGARDDGELGLDAGGASQNVDGDEDNGAKRQIDECLLESPHVFLSIDVEAFGLEPDS